MDGYKNIQHTVIRSWHTFSTTDRCSGSQINALARATTSAAPMESTSHNDQLLASPPWLVESVSTLHEGSWMYLSNQSLLVIIVVGIVAGWLAGRVMEGGGFGLIGDLIVGLLGAFIGDWLLPQLDIHLGTGIIALIINAFVGAVVLLLILRLVTGWRGGARWGRRW